LPLLKDDPQKINSIKGKLASIVSELLTVDSEKASIFCDWLLEELDV